VHADAQPLLERVVYPPPAARLASDAVRVALRRPAALTASVGRIAWGHRSMPVALAKSLAILPQSLAFVADMQARGTRHIHANWATYPGTAAMLISRLTGIPYSFSGHATDIFVHHAMLREKIDAARFVVTCTKFNRSYLTSLVPHRADSIQTVYHGVDLARFARNGTPRGAHRLLTVGTLRACKGIDDLIRAVAILRERGRTVELEIIGEGEDRPALESQVRALGLDQQVFLRGYLPQEEVIPAYHRAAIVALPAHHEDHFGIPNILIEGLAAGTPVVCTELPSLHELIEHGTSGLFVPERDPQALADAIQRLLDDPDAAARMAEEGRRRVAESFDMSQTVAQLAATLSAASAGGTR
jgi:glycosyltransferase involved in cell wall biosynthesis